MRVLTLITLLALTACTKQHPDHGRGDIIKINFRNIKFYSDYCDDSGRVMGYIGSSRKYLVAVRCVRNIHVSEDLIWTDFEQNFLGAY